MEKDHNHRIRLERSSGFQAPKMGSMTAQKDMDRLAGTEPSRGSWTLVLGATAGRRPAMLRHNDEFTTYDISFIELHAVSI